MTEETINILLVEDEEAHAELVSRAFESNSSGFHITVAGTLQKAREHLAQSRPALIITDLILPDGNGIELLQNEEEHQLPIVVMTSHGDEEKAVEAMKQGALEYVVKSEVTLAEMPHITERVLRDWRHVIQRKHAEAALIKSEAFLNATGQIAKVGGWEIDGETQKVFWTNEIYNITEVPPGYDPSSLEAEAIVFFNEEDQLILEKAIQRAFEHAEPYNMEFLITTAKGNKKWVQTICEPIVLDGKVVKLRGTFQDISERKQTDKALQENEEQLRLITDSLPVLISYVDSNFRYRFTNKVYEDWFLRPRDEIHGKHMKEVLGQENFEMIRPNIEIALSGETVSYESIRSYEDGKVRNISSITIPHFGEDGNVKGLFSIVTDITDRKEAEEALRDSEENYRKLYNESKTREEVYRSLLHTSADAIAIYDLQGKTNYINPSFTKIFGWTLEELEGKPIPFVPESEKEVTITSIMEVIHAGKAVHSLQTKRYHKDGRIIDVSVSGSRYYDHEGKPAGLLAILRDISVRRRLEAQLQQSQKMEAIGTLAGGIAHDFNNILQSLMINTEMALYESSAGPFDPHRLEEVLKGSKRAAALVKQILTFSRQGDRELYPLSVSIIVKEALKMLRSSLPTTIEIRQKMVAKKDIVLADPTQIHQIMMNLCTNAAHAMREKGGLLEVHLRDEYLDFEALTPYHDLSPGDYLRLTVSDTGHGISTDTIERIFDPFFTTKERGQGTGMGLAVVHGIIKSLGGDISVDSVPGKGTTFVALLPMAKGEATQKSEVMTPLPMGNEHILFVDDEIAMVNAIQAMLESLGYKVTARTSSIECLEAFRAQPDRFDLIITDMTMPNMTGVDLAKEIIKIKPDIPIILCTGFSEAIDENKAKAMGIRKYIMKPIVMREMAKIIREALGD